MMKSEVNTIKATRKQEVIEFIQTEVELGTGLSFSQLKSNYNEELLFFLALQYVTTTKKALCSAMQIPIEAGCRYKRKFEKSGLLVQSKDLVICPYTRHKAYLISTNSKEFNKLKVSSQPYLF